MQAITKKYYKGYEIVVAYDEYAENPISNYAFQVATISSSKHFGFGSEHYFCFQDFVKELCRSYDWELQEAYDLYYEKDAMEAFKKLRNYSDIVIEPIQFYEHGDMHIWLGGSSSDKWDGGTAGFIYYEPIADKEEIREEMKACVKDIGDWINGRNYRVFIQDENGDTIDECGGFSGLGSEDYAMEYAMKLIDKQ